MRVSAVSVIVPTLEVRYVSHEPVLETVPLRDSRPACTMNRLPAEPITRPFEDNGVLARRRAPSIVQVARSSALCHWPRLP